MSSKRFYVTSTAVIFLIIAFFIGKPLSQGSEMPGPIRTLSKTEWSLLLKSGHRVGPDSAPVKIVEFSDFLCPHCKEFEEVLDQYRKDHPGQIQVIYHNFPLPQHPYSMKLAVSAECVARTGDYGKYYSLLFQNQSGIKEMSIDSMAQKVGVKNLDAFNGCMNEPSVRNKIKQDMSLGMDVGLMQTPTIIINKVFYSGGLTYQELSDAVDYVTHNKN